MHKQDMKKGQLIWASYFRIHEHPCWNQCIVKLHGRNSSSPYKDENDYSNIFNTKDEYQ